MTNKDLLNQYVNVGNKLTEYQVKKLGSGFLKSYLRKRLQQADNSFLYCLEDYEYLLLSEEDKKKYLDKHLLDSSQIQATKVFKYLPHYYRRKVIDRFPEPYKEILKQFNPADFDYLLDKRIEENIRPSVWEFKYFTYEQKEKFLDRRPKIYLFDLFQLLPQELLVKYIGNLKTHNIWIPPVLINRLSKENLLKLSKLNYF